MARSKNFTDLGSLFAYVQQQVTDSLQNSKEVKDEIKDTGSKNVHEYVYQAYSPSTSSPYTRDMDKGGLSDPENFKFIYTANGIEVFNDRKDWEGKNLSRIIISGEGYSIPDSWGYGYEKPRDFITPTVRDLRNGRLGNLLKNDLRRKGFNVL